MSPVVKVDENYEHESLNWLYKLVLKKTKDGSFTSRFERAVKMEDYDKAMKEIERQGAKS